MGRLVVRRRSARAARAVPLAVTWTPKRAMGSVTSSYAFGDDAGEMTEVEWRKKMLEQQTGVTAWMERWVKRDELQRWLQLAATLAIPLSAAIWKAIFRATRRGDD